MKSIGNEIQKRSRFLAAFLSSLGLHAFLLFAMLPGPGLAHAHDGPSSGDQVKINLDSKDIQSEPIQVEKNRTVNGEVVTSGPINVEGTVTGDCVGLGGPITINGKALKDVTSIGGPILITGEVKGDVTSVGGDVTLGSHALVEGDMTLVGGRLTKANGALVKGKTTNVNIPLVGNLLSLTKLLGNVPMNGGMKSESFSYSRKWDWSFLAFIIGIGLIIVLLGVLLSGPTEHIAGAFQKDFWKSAGIGLLIHLLFIPGLFFLIISILGIALIPFVILLYYVAGFMGMAAFSLVFARKFFDALKRPLPTTFLAVVIGYLLLNILMVLASPLENAGEAADTLAGILICANLMLIVCGWIVGIGAAWSTRLGSRLIAAVPAPVIPVVEPAPGLPIESPRKSGSKGRKRSSR